MKCKREDNFSNVSIILRRESEGKNKGEIEIKVKKEERVRASLKLLYLLWII